MTSRRRRSLALVVGFAFVAALLSFEVLAVAGPTKKRKKKLDPKEQALVELGRRLFAEPLASRSGARSCASCHDPDYGFSDPARRSSDDIGRTKRHSQTLIDSALNPSAHWDGEFETVEELVAARLRPPSGKKGLRSHGATGLEMGGSTTHGGGGDDGDDDDGSDDGADGDDGIPDDDGSDDGGTDDDGSDDGVDGGGDDRGDGGGDDSYGGSEAPPESRSPSSAAPPPAEGGATAAPSAPGAPQGEAPAPPPADAPPPPPEPAPADEPQDQDEPQPQEDEDDDDVSAAGIPLHRLPRVADEIERSGRYKEAFKAAFGSEAVTTARLAQAIAAYCRTLEHTEAPFDRFMGGETEALTPEAARGYRLFTGRAGCAQCHTADEKHALFTDYGYYNTGIAWLDRERVRKKLIKLRGPDKKVTSKLVVRNLDKGRGERTSRPGERRAFKVPTLRDLTRRGPYMHNGRFRTLQEVIRYYAKGGSGDPQIDPRIKPFDLNKRDLADLVAYLESLTGTERPGLPERAWKERARRTKLRFVDGKGRALEDFPVMLAPIGDRASGQDEPADDPQYLRSGRSGWLTYVPDDRTHMRLVLGDGIEPIGGDLVPDTCRKATVVVPIDGRSTLVVKFSRDAEIPDEIRALHEGKLVLPGHEPPATVLRRTQAIETKTATLVRYEGWRRTDVPPDVTLRLRPIKDGPEISRTVTLDGKRDVEVDIRID